MAADKTTRMKYMKEKLELVACPYVENVDDSWLSDLLFHPGEPRLRLLQWLLTRFDPTIETLFDAQQQAIVSNLTDSRVGILLFCSNLLGLCGSNEVDLITGSCSKSKQLDFFEELVDLVSMVDILDQSPRPINIPVTPNWSTRSRTLNDAFVQDCHYMHSFCRRENIKEVFKQDIQLFPPDIEKQLATHNKKERVNIPDFTHLSSMATQITLQLEMQNNHLAKLHPKSETAENVANIEKVSKTMALTMSTLSQMITGFTHCYETEMEPWSDKDKPQLSSLGPAFKRVGVLLENFIEMLRSLEKMKTDHSRISQMKSFNPQDNLIPLGTTALGELHDCISILEETTKRRSNSLSNNDSL